MDLNKISPSADMGVAVKGNLFGTVAHHWLTIQNGSGYGSSEVDKYKKIGYSFWLTPVKGLIVEGYADYEKQDPNSPQTASVLSTAKDYAGSTGYYTLKSFVGYETITYTLGVEAFWRTNQNSGIQNATVTNGVLTAFESAEVKKFGYSLFASLITPLPKLKAFARYDYYDPNTKNDVYIKFSDR
ncbi:hypothetical protein JW960_28785 [candidate division KSB1 bacterium]|nr:hypothetical protein [candidate division KSB1 bacterium]